MTNDIERFINNEILSKLVMPKVSATVFFSICPKEIFHIVKTYIESTNTFPKTAMVDDGFLYLDKKPIGRIAAKEPKIKVSNIATYYEEKILANQDN